MAVHSDGEGDGRGSTGALESEVRRRQWNRLTECLQMASQPSFQLAVNVSVAPGRFFRTRVVTFDAQFEILNVTGEPYEVRQVPISATEALKRRRKREANAHKNKDGERFPFSPSDERSDERSKTSLSIPNGESRAWHWPDHRAPSSLQFRPTSRAWAQHHHKGNGNGNSNGEDCGGGNDGNDGSGGSGVRGSQCDWMWSGVVDLDSGGHMVLDVVSKAPPYDPCDTEGGEGEGHTAGKVQGGSWDRARIASSNATRRIRRRLGVEVSTNIGLYLPSFFLPPSAVNQELM